MIFYRGFVIEWIDYRNDCRIYDPKHPYSTVAYEDSFEEAKRGIDFYLDRFEEQ